MKYARIFLIATWILLTISLAIWWLVYGLSQIEKNASHGLTLPVELIRGQRMLYWEGGFLILLLLGGGLGLMYYSLREFKRNQQIREFFATLTHELKTPLASLRLQVESLQEDLIQTPHANIVDRLVGDTARLELQLENALFLAGLGDSDTLHIENLNFAQMVETLKTQWPDLDIVVGKNIVVKGDTRALEGILKNLIQNAKTHGRATKIKLAAIPHGPSHIQVTVEDNGIGFTGDVRRLGKLFVRPTSKSGSGVGLYLSKTLAEKMHGSMEFETLPNSGFRARLTLMGGAS